MVSDHKTPKDREPTPSLAVRESRQVTAERSLTLATAPLKATNVNRGSDPYNTSGSFDRTKNWTRVGKR